MATSASRRAWSPAAALAGACALGVLATAAWERARAEGPRTEDAVQALFGFDEYDRTQAPFPSNRFTVEDATQNTGLRVDLPKPDCAVRPSDCADIDVLDTLDGFNITPRISIPFDGDIDPSTVTSDTVFLLRLGSALPVEAPGSERVGINQVVWDVATRTLHVEADEQLDQYTTYALFVTSGVLDTQGRAIRSDGFARFRHDLNAGQSKDPRLKAWRKELLDALEALHQTDGGTTKDVVVASVFTTLSVTTELEKIRDEIQAGTPAAYDLVNFPLASVTDVTFRSHTGTTPAGAPTFATPASMAGPLRSRPGAISTIAFGKYVSPDYRNDARVIPSTGTLTDAPEPLGSNEIVFDLFLPSGERPASGWPVAIVGHGATLNKDNGPPIQLAATLASRGIATIAINGPGNGGGPLSTITVSLDSGASSVFLAGGRQKDVDGNGVFGAHEGGDAAFFPVRGRDRIRQTVIDLMQLVRVIETLPELDPSRVYYAGQSFGGCYGAVFVAVEPNVRAGAFNALFPFLSAGAQISPVLGRFNAGAALAARVPSLINTPGITQIGGVPVGGSPAQRYNENMPLRNQAPVVNTIAGAMQLQEVFENSEWAQQPGGASGFAPYLRNRPFDGVPKKVLVQFGKGDQSVPNPISADLIRAGDLADATTLFRNDIAFARNPALPKDPHNVLLATLGSTSGGLPGAAAGSLARAEQEQIADFLASDGETIVDPDGADTLFETPIVPPLPESSLSFIP